MNFIKAVELYKKEPTREKLHEVTEKLISEMTLGEKLRMMKGHAMKTTVINLFESGRYYNAEPYGAGGCKRLKIPEVLFADSPRGIEKPEADLRLSALIGRKMIGKIESAKQSV